MSFRQLRLNYYAVQGLLARAYLWMGDKANAYRIAKNEIIDKVNTESLQVFPWVTADQVSDDGRPDLLFSPEVMFSLYNNNRRKFNDNTFSSTLSLGNRLTFFGENKEDSKVALLYEYPNDYRRNQWTVAEPTVGSDDDSTQGTTLCLTKFEDFKSGALEATYRYIIPMIRMSEIYLIAAEATSNREEAFDLIDEIRIHRNCPNLDRTQNFNDALLYEFAGEMIGEGQLYFFYKRRQNTFVISRTGTYDYSMQLNNYVWPIPEGEISKRGQTGK